MTNNLYRFTMNIEAETAQEAWEVLRFNPASAVRVSELQLVDEDGNLTHSMPMHEQDDWEKGTGEAMLEMMRSDSELIMSRAKPSEFWGKK